MNKADFEKRHSMVINEMTQARANYAKLEGHQAEVEHWISVLNAKEALELEAAEKKENGEVNSESKSETA